MYSNQLKPKSLLSDSWTGGSNCIIMVCNEFEVSTSVKSKKKIKNKLFFKLNKKYFKK